MGWLGGPKWFAGFCGTKVGLLIADFMLNHKKDLVFGMVKRR